MITRLIGFYLFLLFLYPVYAQESSRGSSGDRIESKDSGTIRALIVGVSDYNDKKLQLRYADNDAALFNLYLTKIEEVQKENIQLFVNKNATSLNIIRGFKTLIQSAQSGDVVYIYFAGHGDVVEDFGEKEGYLLATDSNSSQEYYAGGSIPLSLLNKVINEIIKKEAKVNLILDACHSGFVFKEGTQKNLGSIQAMFENSTKFISCGPEELSFESNDLQQGYFTHYLVQGLSGNADANSDSNLQYREIDNYLYDNVFNSVSTNHQEKQTPVIRTKNDRAVLKTISSVEKLEIVKSLNNLVVSTVEANERSVIKVPQKFKNKDAHLLKKFNQAISKKAYYGNANSALKIYELSVSNGNLPDSYLQKMQSILLQNLSYDAQLIINQYINGESKAVNSSSFFKQARNLEVCLEIMDEDDFLRDRLIVSKLLLESFGIIKNKNSARYKTAKRNLKEALTIEPRAAYVHNALGMIYNHERVYDSAYFHFEKAKKLINNWSEPVLNLGDNYLSQYKYDEAKTLYDQSSGLTGSKASSYIKLGVLSENQGKYSEAESYYKKAIDVEPESINALIRMSDLEKSRGNLIISKQWYSKSIKIDSLVALSEYGLLDYVFDNKINNKTAEQLFLNALEKSPNESSIYTQYADYLRLTKTKIKRLKLADSLYSIAIRNNPLDLDAYFGKGRLQYKLKNKEKSEELFQMALAQNNTDAKAHYLYANFLNKTRKDDQKAEEFYLKTLKIDSFYEPAYKELVEMYNDRGNQNKSITLLKNHSVKNPSNSNIWKLLGQSHQVNGEFQKAVTAFKKSISADQSNIYSYENLIYSELEVNDYNSVKKHFATRHNLSPDIDKMNEFTEHLLYKASNSKKFGTPSQTKDLYKLAFEVNPTMKTGLAYTNYLYLTSEPENAIEIGESLYDKIKTKADKIDIVKLLIKATIDANDIKKCDEYFNGLLKLQPKHPDHLLIATYASFKKQENMYRTSIKKVNPGILRSQQLKEEFSKESIKNYILSY